MGMTISAAKYDVNDKSFFGIFILADIRFEDEKNSGKSSEFTCSEPLQK